MKWVEIIQLRSLGETRRALLVELKKMAASMGDHPGGLSLEIYSHTALKSDFVIIISGESEEVGLPQNTPGVHLAYLLKEFGLVNCSLWLEA